MRNEQFEVIYRIAQDDSLVFFNDQWNIFAENNGGPRLVRENIYKQSIWDFIHDAETRHIHEILLKRVRSNNAILNLPFRCDSPELRRFMEMDISPREDRSIEYRCRTIKTEKRTLAPYIVGNASDEESFLRMCSWCNKIDVGKDDWLEIEDGISYLNIFSGTKLPHVSHTMCDACMEALYGESDE